MKDYKNINTSHDDELETMTIFVSIGLAVCFALVLFVGQFI